MWSLSYRLKVKSYEIPTAGSSYRLHELLWLLKSVEPIMHLRLEQAMVGYCTSVLLHHAVYRVIHHIDWKWPFFECTLDHFLGFLVVDYSMKYVGYRSCNMLLYIHTLTNFTRVRNEHSYNVESSANIAIKKASGHPYTYSKRERTYIRVPCGYPALVFSRSQKRLVDLKSYTLKCELCEHGSMQLKDRLL
jgi:hypothetical protein